MRHEAAPPAPEPSAGGDALRAQLLATEHWGLLAVGADIVAGVVVGIVSAVIYLIASVTISGRIYFGFWKRYAPQNPTPGDARLHALAFRNGRFELRPGRKRCHVQAPRVPTDVEG